MLEKLRTEFRNYNILIRESLRRQEKTARNEDMFMMLQLLKLGTGEYEKIKTEMYKIILPDTGSSGSKENILHDMGRVEGDCWLAEAGDGQERKMKYV